MRHDRVFLSNTGWDAMLEVTPALRRDPEVTRWVDAGWPLVRRRRLAGEVADGVPLGMPLPPDAGHRRIALLAPAAAVSAVEPALDLAEAQAAAPAPWRSTISECLEAAAQHAQAVRVFGSLAWAAITGRAYLTRQSDLDLMLPIGPRAEPGGFLDRLEDIARRAPMRIDGELVRPDGAALQWREIRSREALVKHEGGVALMAPAAFLSGAAP